MARGVGGAARRDAGRGDIGGCLHEHRPRALSLVRRGNVRLLVRRGRARAPRSHGPRSRPLARGGRRVTSVPVRLPDFFIVGHAKSGTTALYEMLRSHPQIFMPEYKGGAGKEPWYFSRDNPNPQRSGERDITFTGRTAMSQEEYLALFEGARPGQLRGEAS